MICCMRQQIKSAMTSCHLHHLILLNQEKYKVQKTFCQYRNRTVNFLKTNLQNALPLSYKTSGLKNGGPKRFKNCCMFSSLLSKKSHDIASSRCPQLNVTPMLLLSVKPKQGFIGEDYLRITTTNWFRIGMLPWL